MKPCPFCAEQIQDAAIKCRFCGEMLATPPESPRLAGTQKPDPGIAHVVGAAIPSWIRSAWCEKKVRYSALVFLMLGVVAFATDRWNNRPEAEGTVVASAKREPGERSEADYRKALVLMLEKAPLVKTVFASRLGSIEAALRDAYVFSMTPRVGGGQAATWVLSVNYIHPAPSITSPHLPSV